MAMLFGPDLNPGPGLAQDVRRVFKTDLYVSFLPLSGLVRKLTARADGVPASRAVPHQGRSQGTRKAPAM